MQDTVFFFSICIERSNKRNRCTVQAVFRRRPGALSPNQSHHQGKGSAVIDLLLPSTSPTRSRSRASHARWRKVKKTLAAGSARNDAEAKCSDPFNKTTNIERRQPLHPRRLGSKPRRHPLTNRMLALLDALHRLEHPYPNRCLFIPVRLQSMRGPEEQHQLQI
jgi:hypothetical protein